MNLLRGFSLFIICLFFAVIQVSAKYSPLSLSSRGILRSKCADCHSSKALLPFYAQLPFLKDLVKKDVEDGLLDFDIEKDLNDIQDKDLDEAKLIHLETTIADNTMPPLQYAVIHWDKLLTKEEKTVLTKWINSVYKLKGI
jgi:cytochrome c peroxidase